MKILLKPLAELSHCLSKRDLEVPDGQSIGMVLRELGRCNPLFREALFDEQGCVKGFINVLINGKRVDMSQEANVQLHDGDKIELFCYVAGG
jgi:molybdopterin converting factor small subunit